MCGDWNSVLRFRGAGFFLYSRGGNGNLMVFEGVLDSGGLLGMFSGI